MQLAEGIDSDWLSKWQKTVGSFGVQAERNKLATTQADVSRGTDDATERINEAYFDSYGFFGIHREMISDKASSYMMRILYRIHAWCCIISRSKIGHERDVGHNQLDWLTMAGHAVGANRGL